jgi:hypothetical protein
LKTKSWNRHCPQHDPEAGETSSRLEVCLDLDLSGYWFFLGSFSQNWPEMPSAAALEGVGALWILGTYCEVVCLAIARKLEAI